MRRRYGSDLDLDLFGILGVAGHERRAALRANALRFGQLAEFLDHGQVAVVPPCRTGPILPLAPLGRRGRCRIVFPFETIRTVLGRSGFALSTEELILELAVLAAKLFDLGFEPLGPLHGPSVHRLPIPDLLPQFGVLAPQARRLPGAGRGLRGRSCRTRSDRSAGSVAGRDSTSVPSITRTLVTRTQPQRKDRLARNNGLGEALRLGVVRSPKPRKSQGNFCKPLVRVSHFFRA